MALWNEFLRVYRRNGLQRAVAWILRSVLVSFYQEWAYRLVEVLSPFVLDRAELEQKLQRNGSIIYYDRPREVEITLPPDTDRTAKLVSREGTYGISEPFVGTLESVRLIGSYPIPVDSEYNVVLEAIITPVLLPLNAVYSVLEYLSPSRTATARTSEESIETAVLLYNRWNRGYYHWTTEVLTALEGVEQYTDRTGESPKLIVGPNPTQFQLETLELLGYSEADLIRWEQHSGTVETLVVPSNRRELNMKDTSPVAYWWLRERLLTAARRREPAADECSSLVYISRADAPRRQVVNEAEVLDTLEQYGFEKYVLSERHVAENVQLFAQADIIVAPHGAGLTDIIYATDATVIELFRADDIRPAYFVLAQQVGLDYRYLRCESAGPNLVVETAELEQVVTETLSTVRQND